MNNRQEIQGRLDKLQNELLSILAKTVVAVPAFLSVLWWVIEKATRLVDYMLGVLVLVGLLFLLVHWGRTYCKLRKKFYNLEKQFKLQLDAHKDGHDGHTPLIVFRRL